MEGLTHVGTVTKTVTGQENGQAGIPLYRKLSDKLERETGFEPATLALARRCSTTELFPLDRNRSVGWDSTDAGTKLSSNLVGPSIIVILLPSLQ